MLNREQKERSQSEIICIDDLVLENHLLRKIDETVDFTKIYDIVEKHIYGIPSLCRTAEEIFQPQVYRRCGTADFQLDTQ